MPDDTTDSNAELTQLLRRSGIEPDRAHALAIQTINNLRTAAPGITYIGVDPAQLAAIWLRASQAGHTRLTLDITASPDGGPAGCIDVKIIGRDARRSADDAAPFTVPASWDEAVEEMRREGPRPAEAETPDPEPSAPIRDLN